MPKSFKIGSKIISSGCLFFVIEEGQANLGDYQKALSMIEAAASTGADAIEFQLFRAKDFYVKNAPGFELYLKRELSDLQIKDLIGCAKDKGLEFIAVPLSHKMVESLAQAGCSGFNINASDLTNPDIIDAVVASGLPFFLSLPLSAEEEIDWAVNRIRTKSEASFALLHGQHSMASGKNGVDIEHTSLGYIATLRQKYSVPVGFIDHTPHSWMPAVAVAAGADLVTKHLTLARAEKGPDWEVCLEPEEMKEAVFLAKKAKESIETKSKKLAPGENMDRSKMRRSIVAARSIVPGEVIKRNDLAFKRPGTGIDPSKYEELVGKTVLHEIKEDKQINFLSLKE